MTVGQADDFLRGNGFEVDKDRIEALLAYERLLLEWNAKINLVSRRDTSDFFIRHIVGSISFLFTHSLVSPARLLDVGTGGGLPGIPLAILYPDIRVTMLDSIQKKVKAVSGIVAGLRLGNARVECARVEEFPAGPGRKFDYIIARAVSTIAKVVGWCAPLLGPPDGTGRGGSGAVAGSRRVIPTGSFIFLKGGNLAGELAPLAEVAGGASVTVRSLDVEGSGDLLTEKKVIIISK